MTEETKQKVPEVYKAILAVMADLAKEGISKDRKNEQQGYKFRGIDDVYNVVAELLSKHKLLILPNVRSKHRDEKVTQRGGTIYYTHIEVEYTFVSAIDGSQYTCTVVGEAMDSADKSTNKAMSAAYKYLCLQSFCIPTEGDNDADATTPPPTLPKPAPKAPAAKKELAKDPDKVLRDYFISIIKEDVNYEILLSEFDALPTYEDRKKYGSNIKNKMMEVAQ